MVARIKASRNTVNSRKAIEAAVVGKLVDDALSKGFTLKLEGPELLIDFSGQSKEEILSALFSYDDETLLVYEGSTRLGWVTLKYGEYGFDVIEDFSWTDEIGALRKMEALLEAAKNLSDQIAEGKIVVVPPGVTALAITSFLGEKQ